MTEAIHAEAPLILIIADIPERANRLIHALGDDVYHFQASYQLETFSYPLQTQPPALAIVWFPFSSPEVLAEFSNLILRIKGIDASNDIPILLIIDQVGSHWVDPAFQLGVTDILTRPIHPLVLQRRVKMLLAAQKTSQAITDYRQAIRGLRSEEEKLRLIADFTYDWEYWMDQEGQLVYNSPACKKITGRLAQEFISNPNLLLEIVHPEDAERVTEHLVLEKTSDQPDQLEFRIHTATGEIKYIDHACQQVYGNDGRIMGRRVSNRDVTEKKIAEQAIIRNERLAAVGKLLASLAHEINNPLQAITSCVDLLSDFNLPQDEVQEYLKSVRFEIDRLTQVNRQILNFSKMPNSKLVLTSISQVMDQAVKISRKQFDRQRIQLEIMDQPDLPLIMASPDELGQVFLNLILNAVESMPDGGMLQIALQGDHENVEIIIKDNGTGIDPADLDSIFDPFYSTKQHGTGLGLAISQKIIHKFGGHISAVSTVGEGTTFSVILPVHHLIAKDEPYAHE